MVPSKCIFQKIEKRVTGSRKHGKKQIFENSRVGDPSVRPYDADILRFLKLKTECLALGPPQNAVVDTNTVFFFLKRPQKRILQSCKTVLNIWQFLICLMLRERVRTNNTNKMRP